MYCILSCWCLFISSISSLLILLISSGREQTSSQWWNGADETLRWGTLKIVSWKRKIHNVRLCRWKTSLVCSSSGADPVSERWEARWGGWEGKHQCHLLVLMRPECDLNVENMKMIPIRGQTSGLLPKKEGGGDPSFPILDKIFWLIEFCREGREDEEVLGMTQALLRLATVKRGFPLSSHTHGRLAV